MAYMISYSMTAYWTADGAGPMGAVPSAQSKKFTQTGFLQVPGGDSPTQGNFNTAISGASATPTAPSLSNDLSTQVANALAQIQAWSTGGN